MRAPGGSRSPANGRGPRPRPFARTVGPLVTPSPGKGRAQRRGARRNQTATDRIQARGNGASCVKKSRDHLLPAASVTSHYQFIRACVAPWPVQVFCHVLRVSGAGHYQWRGRAQPAAAPLQVAAQAAFTRYTRRYGTRYLRSGLRAGGHSVGRYALRS